MITTTQVSVSTTAVLLHTAVGRTRVRLRGGGTSGTFIGDSNVTTSNGFQIPSTEHPNNLVIDLADGEALYAVRVSGTEVVGVFANSI